MNGAKAVAIPVAVVIGFFSLVFSLGWFGKTVASNEIKVEKHDDGQTCFGNRKPYYKYSEERRGDKTRATKY